jgi:hypothetical protein
VRHLVLGLIEELTRFDGVPNGVLGLMGKRRVWALMRVARVERVSDNKMSPNSMASEFFTGDCTNPGQAF